MSELAVKDVRNLVGRFEDACVSIYLPSAREPRGLLARAEALLARHFPNARPLGDAARVLEARLAKLAPGCGVAYFKSPTTEALLTLPTATPELAVVASSFHVKPLLDQLERRPRFWVVTLTPTRVALYKSTSAGLTQTVGVAVPWLPSGRDDARRLRRFLEDAAVRLRQVIGEVEEPLLILAGAEAVLDAFRPLARRLPVVAELGLDEDDAGLARLHRRAQATITAVQRTNLRRLLFLFESLKARGRATDSFAAVSAACASGRVATLFVERDVRLWGTVDAATGRTALADSQEAAPADDVLDDLAEMALRRGAEVHILTADMMPSASPVAAILKSR